MAPKTDLRAAAGDAQLLRAADVAADVAAVIAAAVAAVAAVFAAVDAQRGREELKGTAAVAQGCQ